MSVMPVVDPDVLRDEVREGRGHLAAGHLPRPGPRRPPRLRRRRGGGAPRPRGGVVRRRRQSLLAPGPLPRRAGRGRGLGGQVRQLRRRRSCWPGGGGRRYRHDAGMLEKSRITATALGLRNVEFRDGIAERLPVPDGWADVVISNGVINLCADKRAVFDEILRVLRPGGRLQFADSPTGAQCSPGPCATSTRCNALLHPEDRRTTRAEGEPGWL